MGWLVARHGDKEMSGAEEGAEAAPRDSWRGHRGFIGSASRNRYPNHGRQYYRTKVGWVKKTMGSLQLTQFRRHICQGLVTWSSELLRVLETIFGLRAYWTNSTAYCRCL